MPLYLVYKMSNEIMRFPPDTIHRDHKLSFDDIDNIPYVENNWNVLDHKTIERWEQLIAKEYIIPSDSVLELGGRFGTVSCVINNILDDPIKHVVIEPEDAVIPALLYNRKKHNSFFTVYKNIICSKPKTLICAGHATRAVDCADGDVPTPSITLDEIVKHHGFGFTALVADCEGCMEDFVSSHIDFVRQLRFVTYEKDFPELSDYTRVASMLVECGLTCIQDDFHTIWIRK